MRRWRDPTESPPPTLVWYANDPAENRVKEIYSVEARTQLLLCARQNKGTRTYHYTINSLNGLYYSRTYSDTVVHPASFNKFKYGRPQPEQSGLPFVKPAILAKPVHINLVIVL